MKKYFVKVAVTNYTLNKDVKHFLKKCTIQAIIGQNIHDESCKYLKSRASCPYFIFDRCVPMQWKGLK